MLKKIIPFLSIILFGCSSINTTLPSTVVKTPKEKTTSIFNYYVDPVTPAQAASIVEGRFVWQDGCIYLIDKRGNYSTAMFPLYPKEDVKWDEKSRTLNLKGHIFRMGDWIETNGSYDTYVPNTGRFIEYEKQGEKKCLNSSLAYIGTMSISKN